jgi:hypothetical protein
MIDLAFNQSDFYPVDTHHNSKGISIVGNWYSRGPTQGLHDHPSLQNAFSKLHPALQQTCRSIHFPPDAGIALMDEVQKRSGLLYGASVAWPIPPTILITSSMA